MSDDDLMGALERSLQPDTCARCGRLIDEVDTEAQTILELRYCGACVDVLMEWADREAESSEPYDGDPGGGFNSEDDEDREPTDDELANRHGVEGGIPYRVDDAMDEHDWRL